jgi:hypothetical protein
MNGRMICRAEFIDILDVSVCMDTRDIDMNATCPCHSVILVILFVMFVAAWRVEFYETR